jgi:hypothetical protein
MTSTSSAAIAAAAAAGVLLIYEQLPALAYTQYTKH